MPAASGDYRHGWWVLMELCELGVTLLLPEALRVPGWCCLSCAYPACVTASAEDKGQLQ